jgi:Flp pilus assembly protein TadD
VAEAVDVLKDDPQDNLDAGLLLAKAYMRQGNVAAARAAHERAISQAPADARAYIALAALEPTDSPKQVAALQRGLKAVPGNPTLTMFLGSIHERQGRLDAAISVYEVAVAKNPADTIMTNNLAALLLDRGKDKASLARALELARPFATGNDPILLDTLGWAHFRNDDFPSAVLVLERAVAADQNNALLQYHLGKAYAAAGNPVGARQHLMLALEKGGDQTGFADDARVALGRLGT